MQDPISWQNSGEGLFRNVSFDAYAARKAINASSLKKGRDSMLHMERYMLYGISETPAMRLGRLIHILTLEPKKFKAECSVYDGARRGNSWIAFQESNSHLDIYTASEHDNCKQVASSIRSNKDALKAINSTDHEVSMAWLGGGKVGKGYHMGKARMDGYKDTSGNIIEVKTTNSVDPHKFARTCFDQGTHIQIGWQIQGLKKLGAKIGKILIPAVEQKPPYDVIVFEPDADFCEYGEGEAVRIAGEYTAAVEAGLFMGIGKGKKQVLSLPEWVMARGSGMDLMMGGEAIKL